MYEEIVKFEEYVVVERMGNIYSLFLFPLNFPVKSPKKVVGRLGSGNSDLYFWHLPVIYLGG
jgi:hypothetical protein